MRGKSILKNKQCWVIKIGSSILTGNGVCDDIIDSWIYQISLLRKNNIDVVLVSSGAISEGMNELGLNKRPETLQELQAIASIGQMNLVKKYKKIFFKYEITTGQILLTHDDISNKERCLNVQQTLKKLIEWNSIPIINENDTVATEEICFGDNDTLAAMTVNLIGANKLIILTDQQGIFDKNPRVFPQAKIIKKAFVEDDFLDEVAGGGGPLGTGGMITKVYAARLAAKSGASTIIVDGKQANILTRIGFGESVGTLLEPINAKEFNKAMDDELSLSY